MVGNVRLPAEFKSRLMGERTQGQCRKLKSGEKRQKSLPSDGSIKCSDVGRDVEAKRNSPREEVDKCLNQQSQTREMVLSVDCTTCKALVILLDGHHHMSNCDILDCPGMVTSRWATPESTIPQLTVLQPTVLQPTIPQRLSNGPIIPGDERMARGSTMCSSRRMFNGSNLASDAPFGTPPVDSSHRSVRSSAAHLKECQERSPDMTAAANMAAHESIQYGDTY